jgi:predicted neuraminidase
MSKTYLSLTCLAVVWVAGSVVAGPELESELIFPLQGKHVHSSCTVECPNGDLLACWFHGSGERSANDVQVQGARLKKGSKEWSPVFQMADTPDLPDCNPVMFIDGKDRLHLVWIAVLAKGWQHSLTRHRISTDYQGEGPPKWDWQDLIILLPGEEFPKTIREKFEELNVDEGWGEYAPPYTKLVADAAEDPIKRQTGWMPRIRPTFLPSGRILLPLYSDGFNVSMVAISDDDGDTWRASLPLVGFGPIQPTIARKKDGTLVAYMRDSGPPPYRVLVSESKDDGESWSAVVDTDIPNPGSSLASTVLKDGRWVLIYNDTEEGRRSLALSMSDDEGKTWKWTRHLESEQDGSYAYPNIYQASEGRIHASYSYKKEGKGAAIKHVNLNAEWIEQGD